MHEVLSIDLLGIRRRCSVHLINEGVSFLNEDGNREAIIQWGVSAPGNVNKSQVKFMCSLDKGPRKSCK